MNKIHNLKVWPEFYKYVSTGEKPFEVRLDDRNFKVGDGLWLKEYNPKKESYTGNKVYRIITYKLKGGQFGIQEGFCVLGLG